MKSRPPLPAGPYLIVGLARSGVAAALALRERGERVVGVDVSSQTEIQALLDAGVEAHLGEDGLALLDGAATVVKSPGVPEQAAAIAQARARGMVVLGELELAWRMLPNELIAVTGTNGKTTTVEMIGHIHRQAGLPVTVAGNVGRALSGLAGCLDERAIIVCETSSFQLQDTLAFAPEAAVLLNITPDHLDRHGTMEDYRAAKLQIFARQGSQDVAVIPLGFDAALPGTASRVRFGVEDLAGGGGERAEMSLRAGALWWSGQRLIGLDELRLRGAHNVENAMAAAAVCLARGLDADAVRAGLRTFAGVPHRLEEVARRDGVLYVNDSKATNVASTIVALDAMASDGLPVHLILGGLGKGQDFTPLSDPVRRGCRAVYLIGEDAPSIERALLGAGVVLRGCDDLDRALAEASRAAAPNEVVLLSPGCASFDQFADFEDRGQHFKELVRRL